MSRRAGRWSADGPVDLRPWLRFPVTEVPRPVVLLSPAVEIDQGFVDGGSKAAWLSGAVVADVPLPPGVLGLAIGRQAEDLGPAVLHITAVERCVSEFLCDRGPRVLPAYRLGVSGSRDGCVVLDPDVQCWWPSRADWSASNFGGGRAQVDDDDLTIHFPAVGGALTQFHHADFVEYETCVVGHAITSEREVPPGMAVRAFGIKKQVIGRLKNPLAGRVLLNSRGLPLAVVNSRSGVI